MYKAMLKSNNLSEYDQSFQGDVTVSDDMIIKDNLDCDNFTCTDIQAKNAEFSLSSLGGLSISEIAKANLVNGDNYILMKASGTDAINKRNQFLRFRSGGNPLSYSGLCFSNFDSNHLRFYQNGTNFFMGRSTEASTTPTNDSFTDNVMNISATTGNINIGSSISQTGAKLTVTGGTENLRLQSYGSDIPTLGFYRSQGSETSPLTLSNGQTVGRLGFYARDASSYNFCASINVLIDGEINTASDPSDIPTRISFFTTLDGTNSLSERMTIKNDGGIGIGVSIPNTAALLDLTSTTRGFLPPRMTTTQKNAISTPATGLIVYDTTLNNLCTYNGSSWVELIESFSRSFLKLNRTTTLITPGVITWNTNIKNGSDFNFTNNGSVFSVNSTGYYEINANFEFLNITGERLIETLFERVTPSQLDISRIFTSCTIPESGDTFIASHLQDIVTLTAGETYRFSFGSLGGSSADLSTNSKVIIKRIT
jgi:hypothetical protein